MQTQRLFSRKVKVRISGKAVLLAHVPFGKSSRGKEKGINDSKASSEKWKMEYAHEIV